MSAQTVLRTLLWLALGGWVGSWAFFAFVVSRIAFQVLPGDVAGDLAGELLTILHWLGIAAGLIVAATGAALGRRGLVVGLPVVLAMICLASEWWISPEVAAVRPSVLGPENSAVTQARFRTLHALSLGLFMAVHLATIVLVWLEARLDANPPSTPRKAPESA